MADFYKFDPGRKAVWVLQIPARRAGKMQAAREALTAADRADTLCRALARQLRQQTLTPSAEELLEGVRLPETPESGRHLREPPTAESIVDWNDAVRNVREQIIEAMRKQKEEKEMREKTARETAIMTTLTVTNILPGIRSGMTAETWADMIAAHMMEDAHISPDNVRVESVQVFTRTDAEPEERRPKQAAARPKIYAVDFDGTLCDNKWPEIGEPHPGVIAFCKGAQKAGCKIILWTNRVGERLREAVRWCAERGLRFDAVNENLPETVAAFGGDTRKIVADVYIDDKAKAAQDIETTWSEFSAVTAAFGSGEG